MKKGRTRSDRQPLSLRRQQLLFFGGIVAILLILITTTARMTEQHSREFGVNLSRYFLIHELRTEIAITHDTLVRYFRSGDEALHDAVHEAIPRLFQTHRHLRDTGITDQQSLFEVRALAYGLAAYHDAVALAVHQYQTADPLYPFTREYAGRLTAYMDLYTQRLLRIQLDRGRLGHAATLNSLEILRLTSVSIFLVISAALGAFALLFSRSVTRPLEVLAIAAQRLSHGDFEAPPVALPTSRELHTVAEAFNTMSAGIRSLVQDLQDKHSLELQLRQKELDNISMKHSLREAQLVALQSQMNPHFLFNTLNSAARTARTESAARSEELIRGLSLVLRYILRNPRRSVSVAEELEVAEQYLTLQRVRFGSRLTVRISADAAVRDAQMPPLILQPLVENAVIYGIEPQETGGTVEINATADTDCCLKVDIRDNGAGMPQELVDHLLCGRQESESDGTSGIGVFNVRNRLNLFFGSRHSFTIASAPGEGTCVTLRLPMQVSAETYALEMPPEEYHGIQSADR